jgi:C-terminal processing protease CtpA/Prc
VEVHFVENLPVISGLSAAASNDLALKIGDVINRTCAPLGKLIENWRPYYATSNDAALMRDIGHYMTRGDCGEAIIGIHRENRDFKVTVKRVTASINDYNPGKHDLPGPAFRLVSKEVAYLKLSSVKEAECTHYIEEAAGTKGLIIDIRNYPSEFVVFALGSHLVEKETEFVRFTEGDLANPGAFHWTKPLSLSPDRPPYAGKIVILVDESSMSQAEYTSMAFRSAHGAMVIGSTTSGADGNVSPFALPGGLHTMISGIGVFYPDKTATQRIGIKPSIEVRPTVAGIRAGRDEVLEEALRQILGRRVPASEIEKMARP